MQNGYYNFKLISFPPLYVQISPVSPGNLDVVTDNLLSAAINATSDDQMPENLDSITNTLRKVEECNTVGDTLNFFLFLNNMLKNTILV